MSTRVYLTDEVMKLEGFSNVTDGCGERGFPLVRINDNNGRLYLNISYGNPVPAIVAGVVDEVSIFEVIPGQPSRETGIYNLESATAMVEFCHCDHGVVVRREITITAKTLEDAREILRRIKIGSIRPDESYEGQQSGMSRVELEAELARMKQGANGALESLKADLRTLCRELEKGWPFCTKDGVRDRISTLLANYHE